MGKGEGRRYQTEGTPVPESNYLVMAVRCALFIENEKEISIDIFPPFWILSLVRKTW